MKRTLAFLCFLNFAIPYLLGVTASKTFIYSRHTHTRRTALHLRQADTGAGDSPAPELPELDSIDPENSLLPISTDADFGLQDADPDIATIYKRRLNSIVQSLSGADQIPAWLSALGLDGKWPDVEINYATGCAAQRANWPAQVHWSRILTMAAAWHGGVQGGSEEYVQDSSLLEAISSAMDYWYSRDFTNYACMDAGGTDRCPCDNPDNWLWNTNWFSNIILIPRYVARTCLILGDELDLLQREKCVEITGRAYQKFYEPINGVSAGLTGANALDVAQIGMDRALLTGNSTLLEDAYKRVHAELVIRNATRADGIRIDGAFGQHAGILYNGNYGKDFANVLMNMELEAAGTRFAANPEAQSAFGTLFEGNKWMIVLNSLTRVLHWDFSVIGRFLAFPVIDDQASGSIKMNVSKVAELGRQWNNQALISFADGYLEPVNNNANGNNLIGNKMFFTNDFMVHRGPNHVTTLKLWSSRTKHTECTNLANPFGFHLADGAQYTYTVGDEYENVPGAWDWYLIPGITVDYGVTPLICSNSRILGIQPFVGGVSDGSRGLAVMRYINPVTRSLSWKKAWFFLDDNIERVMVANITTNNTSAPIYSVLDQRRLSGPIYVDNRPVDQSTTRSRFESLWHSNVGYTFDDSRRGQNLEVQFGERQGNWTAIGTSTQPPYAMNIFSAKIHHEDLDKSLSYTIYPAVDRSQFRHKANRAKITTVRNDAEISAVFDERNDVFMAVFWNAAGGKVKFYPGRGIVPITVEADGNCALMYDVDSGDVSVSDPSQTLEVVKVTISLGSGRRPSVWGRGLSKTLVFQLPRDGVAGDTVTLNVRG